MISSTLGLNTCGLLPMFNLHPLGSPVPYPASLEQAKAITCLREPNLLPYSAHRSRESPVRVGQLGFGLDRVSLHMVCLLPKLSLPLGRAVQNFSVGPQNISNYRRTAECSQNGQTFVVFARTKFY